MADDDASDKEPQGDAANPEADGGPPPLADESAEAEAQGQSAADSMEEKLPDALTGSSASVPLGQGTMSEKDERTFAMLAHILGIVPLVGPLVIWIMKKDESPFVDDQGKESVSFQLVVLIAFAVSAVIAAIPWIGPCVSSVLWSAIGVGNIIMVILAGMKANEGVAYRYPYALRVI